VGGQYKAFLDDLTPDEWFKTQIQLKQERQQARKVARIEAKRAAWEVSRVVC